MKFRLMLIAVMALSFGAAVQATTLKEDTKEFGVEGGFDPNTANGPDFHVALTYGQFVADNFEVGGRIAYDNNDNTSLFDAGPFVELNFDIGSEFVPFLGASVEYAHGDTGKESNGALALTGYGGAKYFLTTDVAIQARLSLSGATDKIYPKKDGSDSTDIRADFGMSFYFP